MNRIVLCVINIAVAFTFGMTLTACTKSGSKKKSEGVERTRNRSDDDSIQARRRAEEQRRNQRNQVRTRSVNTGSEDETGTTSSESVLVDTTEDPQAREKFNRHRLQPGTHKTLIVHADGSESLDTYCVDKDGYIYGESQFECPGDDGRVDRRHDDRGRDRTVVRQKPKHAVDVSSDDKRIDFNDDGILVLLERLEAMTREREELKEGSESLAKRIQIMDVYVKGDEVEVLARIFSHNVEYGFKLNGTLNTYGNAVFGKQIHPDEEVNLLFGGRIVCLSTDDKCSVNYIQLDQFNENGGAQVSRVHIVTRFNNLRMDILDRSLEDLYQTKTLNKHYQKLGRIFGNYLQNHSGKTAAINRNAIDSISIRTFVVAGKKTNSSFEVMFHKFKDQKTMVAEGMSISGPLVDVDGSMAPRIMSVRGYTIDHTDGGRPDYNKKTFAKHVNAGLLMRAVGDGTMLLGIQYKDRQEPRQSNLELANDDSYKLNVNSQLEYAGIDIQDRRAADNRRQGDQTVVIKRSQHRHDHVERRDLPEDRDRVYVPDPDHYDHTGGTQFEDRTVVRQQQQPKKATAQTEVTVCYDDNGAKRDGYPNGCEVQKVNYNTKSNGIDNFDKADLRSN